MVILTDQKYEKHFMSQTWLSFHSNKENNPGAKFC